MTMPTGRRSALLAFGLATIPVLLRSREIRAAEASCLLPPGAASLSELAARLDRAPRRRDYASVPMILEDPGLWDAEALRAVIAYQGTRKQVWDSTDIESPWLNLIRNSLNTQVYAFRHPDFLAVSATHGSAHLALFDDVIWDKYKLASRAGHGIDTNSFARRSGAATNDVESQSGIFAGPQGNRIPTLQSRGVVFLACHNAIWEVTAKLRADGMNPDRLSQEAMAAELTNHLLPGVVLTPGIVGTLIELQASGFRYVK